MIVEVYRNLHKKKFSVRDPSIHRVIGHVERVLLTEAQFRVSEAGRQRVLKYRRKNVHAVVRGVIVDSTSPVPVGWERVRYDPYTTKTFVWDDNNEPVFWSPAVYIGPEGVFAKKDAA